MIKRLHYQNMVFRELYYAPSLSCAALSQLIGKSIPLVMQVLNDLIEEGVVEEDGLAPSSGGRRPNMYSVKPDAMYFVSVAMDQLITRIHILNFKNESVAPSAHFDLNLAQNPQALFQLKDHIESTILKSKVPKKKIVGIGIGMPGFIDTQKGANHSFLLYESGSISQYLGQELGLPVYIDNDSSVIALAEHRFGAAKGIKNAMVINLGWGIGLGLILNNALYRGENGFAGEFSHIPLYDNGKLCSCGKKGCLETETSLQVIIEKAEAGLKKKGTSSLLNAHFRSGSIEKSWTAISKAALGGDQFVIKLLSEVGYDIGKGTAVLVHLFNPDMVILSGRGAQVGRVWEAPVLQAIHEHCIPLLASNTKIKISKLGYKAELIGAAALVMENQIKIKIKSGTKKLVAMT